MVHRVPLSCGHRPIEGKGHDQDEAIQAVGEADLGVLEAEAAGFEVRKHRFDAPPLAVVQGAQGARLFGHGDDPGLGMAGIMEDANVRPHAASWAASPGW